MYFIFKKVIHQGEEIEEYLIKLENIDEVHYECDDSYILHIRCDNYQSDIDVGFESMKYLLDAFDQVKKYCLSLNSTIIGIK